jgi:Heme/copper-type cytochrome/quinol oxidases, subunit 2
MPKKNIALLSIAIIAVLMFVFSAVTICAADQKEIVIKITAKKFEYSPNSIKIKKGIPVILELTSLDKLHGFNCPKLGVRTDIEPGKVSRVRILAQRAGVYEFHCDIFCGDGHEDMYGKIIVED